MTTWLLTDPHFSHAGILNWTDRPADHEEQILRGCQTHLHGGDLLLLLGDLHLGDPAELPDLLTRLIPAGVQVTLIRGNHDLLSEEHYRTLGLSIVDALTYRGLYLSHLGTRTLPDDARGQLLGHYHHLPVNPALPHALKLSPEQDGFLPLQFSTVLKRMEHEGRLRELPERVSDKWFLREAQYAQISAEHPGGHDHLLPGEPYALTRQEFISLTLRGKALDNYRQAAPQEQQNHGKTLTLHGNAGWATLKQIVDLNGPT